MLVLVHTAAHSVYLPASLPTPHQRVWHLGPVPVRPYALCILVGIGIALWWGARRWRADGGPAGVVPRIALWMVPFAIIGGRIQHVAAHSGRYFSAGSDSWNALKFWHGGLGIWGVLLFAGLGALIGGRRKGIPLFSLADALAPGVAVAQALDRWGNWLNQRPYDHPAAVAGTAWGRSLRTVPHSHLSTFESAFLYESLWCLGAAALVVAVGRSYALERGSAFALLVGTYSLGRGWLEWRGAYALNDLAASPLDKWASLVVFSGAVLFLFSGIRHGSPNSRDSGISGIGKGRAAGPSASNDGGRCAALRGR